MVSCAWGICPDAPASKGYQGRFKIQLMRKNFRLAVETAERVGVKLALGETGLKVIRTRCSMRGVRIWILGWCIGFWGVERIGRKIYRVQRIRFRYNILWQTESRVSPLKGFTIQLLGQKYHIMSTEY